MRLTEQELITIKHLFSQHFGETDHLWLFGSRVDDSKMGGDIDLYVETFETDTSRLVRTETQFVTDLSLSIGDQKIDLVVNQVSKGQDALIYQQARSTGVLLI